MTPHSCGSAGLARDFAELIGSRIVTVAASFFYAYALHFSFVHFLNPEWEHYGFTYRPQSAVEFLATLGLLISGALLVPRAVDRPSAIVVLLLYIVVYIPSVVITMGLDTHRLLAYGPSLLMLAVAFALVCVGARWSNGGRTTSGREPNDLFAVLILSVWALCCAVLIVNYRNVMSFAGLSEIYAQRAAGAATSLLMGYIQTYFANVLSPALIALGLLKSRLLLTALGCAGCVIMYMINAQRTVILLPIVIIAFYFVLSTRVSTLRTTSFILVVIGGAVILSSKYYEDNVVASLLALLLVFRTLGLPGLTFSQYHDLFSGQGHTFWSHVRGLGSLLPTPPAYLPDPSWPGLGYMVGDRVYGDMEHNVVANLFSGDGVAAAGAIGVLVMGIMLAFWLRWYDRASEGWNRNFAILVTLPLGLSLTNGHFFTMLLSFGGLFWILTFYLFKLPASSANRP